LKQLLLSTTLLGLASAPLLAVAPAAAQEAPQAAQEGDVVVVTGTRIAQEGFVSSSPIQTIDSDELGRQQPVDVEDVLRDMPQFLPGNGSQANNGSTGTSTVDLRGLTTPRTLPLIDGKRMVGFDPNGLFDVTVIPLALLERVDVVTGGASAVYGSDAIAGVVNFILNDDFQGAQLDATYSITDHGDGETDSYQGTIGAGFDDGRGNVVLSVGYLNKEAVFQTRGPGAVPPALSSTTVPAAIDNAVGPRQAFTQTGNLDDFDINTEGFNFNPQNLYQTPQTRWTATALAKYEFNDSIEAYSRFIYSDSVSAPNLASSGTFGFFFGIPVDNPFLTPQALGNLTANNPVVPCAQTAQDNGYAVTAPPGDCVNVGVRWRAVPVGPRAYVFDYNTFQALGGLRGDFYGWNWDLAAAHGETSLKRQQNNDVNAVRVQQAFFATSPTTCFDPSNFCAPLNIFNPSIPPTAEALDFIRLNLQVQAVTTQDYVTFNAGRELAFLKSPWANTGAAVSVGAEYRAEESHYEPDAASQSGDSPGFGQTLPVHGQYDVREVFGEAIMPIVEDKPFFQAVNLELGYRYSDYSTSGNVDSYKAGMDWSPIDGLRFRGMYQRAVRAANISELFAPFLPGTGDLLIDPCANGAPGSPLTGQLAALCIATGVPTAAISGGTLAQPTSGQVNNFSGGNPDLTPEKADTYTIGAVWQPDFLPGLGATIDYYNIKVDNAISLRPINDVMDGCYNPVRNTTMVATFSDCLFIHRNTINGSLEGPLQFGVEQTNENIGEVKAEGIDYSISYAFDIGEWGGIEASLNGTHVIESSYIPVLGGERINCEGVYGKQCGLPSTVTATTGGPTPEDRFVQRTTWTYGPFDFSYLWRYLSGTDVEAAQLADTDPESASIDAVSYIDLFFSWQVYDWAKLKFSVTNVFDEEAPFVATETGSTVFNSGNTYPSTYDVLGRVFTVGVTTKF
jgi:outer membrane receptor protein involved in Fe transport